MTVNVLDEKQAANMPIKDRVKKLRKSKGMTQQQLAAASGLHPKVVERVEQGDTANPGWDTVQKLADGLGVSLDELRDPPKKKK